MERKKRLQIQVAVDPASLQDIEGVTRRCKAQGMVIDEALDEIGVLIGSIDPGKIEKLRQVEGVTAVEESEDYELPPPESDLQ